MTGGTVSWSGSWDGTLTSTNEEPRNCYRSRLNWGEKEISLSWKRMSNLCSSRAIWKTKGLKKEILKASTSAPNSNSNANKMTSKRCSYASKRNSQNYTGPSLKRTRPSRFLKVASRWLKLSTNSCKIWRRKSVSKNSSSKALCRGGRKTSVTISSRCVRKGIARSRVSISWKRLWKRSRQWRVSSFRMQSISSTSCSKTIPTSTVNVKRCRQNCLT